MKNKYAENCKLLMTDTDYLRIMKSVCFHKKNDYEKLTLFAVEGMNYLQKN